MLPKRCHWSKILHLDPKEALIRHHEAEELLKKLTLEEKATT
jgi:hypothetical protein